MLLFHATSTCLLFLYPKAFTRSNSSTCRTPFTYLYLIDLWPTCTPRSLLGPISSRYPQRNNIWLHLFTSSYIDRHFASPVSRTSPAGAFACGVSLTLVLLWSRISPVPAFRSLPAGKVAGWPVQHAATSRWARRKLWLGLISSSLGGQSSGYQ